MDASLFDDLPDGILTHDGRQVLSVNAAAIALFGAVGSKVLVGRPFLDLVHPESRDAARHLCQPSPDYVSPRAGLLVVRVDGSVVESEVIVRCLRPGRDPLFVASLRDISGEKRSRADLETLERLSRALADVRTVNDVAITALGEVADHLRAARVAIYRVVDENRLTLLAAIGVPDDMRRLVEVLPVTLSPDLRRAAAGEVVYLGRLESGAPGLATALDAVSALALPLAVGDESRGILLALFGEERFFGDIERRHLQAMTLEIGLAIELASRNAERERQLAVSEAIGRLLRSSVTAPGTRPFLRDALKIVTGLLTVDGGNYRSYSPTRDTFRLVASIGITGDLDVPVNPRLRPLVDPGRFVAVIGLPNDEPARRAREIGIESYLAVPVLREGHVRGALFLVSRKPRRFDSAELAIVETLAREIGLALDSLGLRSRLRRLLHEARRKNDELEAFVGGVSHELKTPLTVVRGAAEILGDDLATTIPAPAVPIFRSITDSVDRMHHALDGLLELSRIGLVSIPREPTEVALVVERALDLAAIPLEKRKITVHRQVESILAPLQGERVTEGLVNLLVNAAKYGCDPERPQLTIAARRDGRWLVLFVEDNGPGIPAESLDSIFEPFRRGTNSSGQPGSGLGLFLVRRIAEAHGGSLHGHSQPGHGTRFEIRLPLQTEDDIEVDDDEVS